MRSISGRVAVSTVALMMVLGACTEGDGLDVVTNDARPEVEVGGDLALPDVGGTEDGGSVLAADEDPADDSIADNTTGDTSGAPIDPEEGESASTVGSSAAAAPSDDGSGGTPAADPAPDTPSNDGSVGASAGNDPADPLSESAKPTPEADPASDPATAGRVDVAYPASSVTDLASGDEVDLTDELSDREKRTLLWFWQPGATPSAAEADVVQRLALERSDNVDVIAIGTGGDLTAAQLFLADTGLSAASILWDGGTNAAEHYGVDSLPASVLLDRNGDIIGRWSTLSPEVFEFLAILP